MILNSLTRCASYYARNLRVASSLKVLMGSTRLFWATGSLRWSLPNNSRQRYWITACVGKSQYILGPLTRSARYTRVDRHPLTIHCSPVKNINFLKTVKKWSIYLSPGVRNVCEFERDIFRWPADFCHWFSARQRKLTVNDVMRDGAACSSELETCREISYR